VLLLLAVKSRSHYARARTRTTERVRVVMEPVDFYLCTHTDCSYGRVRTHKLSRCAWCCVILLQYHAVARTTTHNVHKISVVLDCCGQLQRLQSTDVDVCARMCSVHGRPCAQSWLLSAAVRLRTCTAQLYGRTRTSCEYGIMSVVLDAGYISA